MELSIQDLANLVNGEVERAEDVFIRQVSSLKKGVPGCISFLANPKYEQDLYSSRASAVLVNKDFQPKRELSTVLVRVSDPYLSFALLLEEYQRTTSLKKSGIDKLSSIGENVSYGKEIFVDSFVKIGQGTSLGNHVKIHSNVSIGENCVIGDNTVIHPGVTIYPNTIIGSYCIIHAGAVLGSEGFGFAPQPDGSYHPIPQVGNVILEDHVSIGANTVIDCATFDSTIIKKGVKLDNLIQIAHNVEIGENTAIAAQAGISGSTIIGSQCIIGGQAGITGHIQIDDHSKIAGKAGISKSVKNKDVLFGVPAIPLGQYNRSYSVYKKLPELLKRIELLEEKILS